MHVFITGASGLIGQHLCKSLNKRDGIVLSGLSRNSKKAGRKNPIVNHWHNNFDTVDFSQIDGVINLAGEPIADRRWSSTRKQALTTSRVDLTHTLVDRMLQPSNPPQWLISGSAIGYYGRQGSERISETFTNCHDEFSHTLCRDWEAATQPANDASIRVCLLRTGLVLARNGGALKKMIRPFQLGLGGPVGSGDQWMSWIHIDDMVRAIEHLIDNSNLHGPFNCTAPHAVTNLDFSRVLAKLLNRPCAFKVPHMAMKTLLGEMSDLLLYGQHVVPTALRDSGFEFSYPALENALVDLLRP